MPSGPYGPQPPYPGPHPVPPHHGYPPLPPHHGYRPLPPPRIPPELVASRGRRVLAKLLDLLVVAVIIIVATALMVLVVDGSPNPPVWAVVVTVALYVLTLVFGLLLYVPLFEAKGGTVGKRLLGLRVVSVETGQPLSPGTSFGRHLLGLGIGSATLVPIGYLWFLWDRPYRQCLHDKLMGTAVIRPPSATAADPPAVPFPPPPPAEQDAPA